MSLTKHRQAAHPAGSGHPLRQCGVSKVWVFHRSSRWRIFMSELALGQVTTEDFSVLKQASQGVKILELREYIDSIQDEPRKGILTDALEAALECIEANRLANRLPSTELHIHIYDEDDPQAVASEDNRNIRFSTGLIEHYERTRFPDLSQVLPGAPQVFGVNWVMNLGLAWSLCHEYIHIIRRHDSVSRNLDAARQEDINTIPSQKRSALSLSAESVDKAFEHDADLCAAAAIYRYLQRRMGLHVDDIIIRKMALFYIYWGVRALPENRFSDSHPALHERLYEIVQKIAQVPVQQFSKDYVIGQDLEQQLVRVVELVRFALSLEVIYAQEYNLDRAESLIHLWSKHLNGKKHTQRSKDWSKLGVWVEEASGTSADTRKDIFYKMRKQKAIAAKLVKTARKKQRAARKRR
jgi:hypothetical protein